MPEGPQVLIWNRVLVAIDDTLPSLAAVYYMAAVLGGQSNCRAQLLGVWQAPQRDNFASDAEWRHEGEMLRERLKEMLAKAQSILTEAGLPPANLGFELIETKGRPVGQAIMDYQAAGGYGTVVVGRRGLSKAEEFLMGSVSRSVVQKAHQCCVWVVA